MKPSAIFDAWIKANAECIESETEDFRQLVAFVSFDLKLIERPNHKDSAAGAEAMIARFERLRAELTARGVTLPDVTLPKIKVVRPRGKA